MFPQPCFPLLWTILKIILILLTLKDFSRSNTSLFFTLFQTKKTKQFGLRTFLYKEWVRMFKYKFPVDLFRLSYLQMSFSDFGKVSSNFIRNKRRESGQEVRSTSVRKDFFRKNSSPGFDLRKRVQRNGRIPSKCLRSGSGIVKVKILKY